MKKKKNNQNKNSSILVTLYPATDKEVNKLLNSLNITGVRVSNLISRWSIDVPFWKESYYMQKLLDSELVKKVHQNYANKKYFKENEQEKESDDDE